MDIFTKFETISKCSYCLTICKIKFFCKECHFLYYCSLKCQHYNEFKHLQFCRNQKIKKVSYNRLFNDISFQIRTPNNFSSMGTMMVFGNLNNFYLNENSILPSFASTKEDFNSIFELNNIFSKIKEINTVIVSKIYRFILSKTIDDTFLDKNSKNPKIIIYLFLVENIIIITSYRFEEISFKFNGFKILSIFY